MRAHTEMRRHEPPTSPLEQAARIRETRKQRQARLAKERLEKDKGHQAATRSFHALAAAHDGLSKAIENLRTASTDFDTAARLSTFWADADCTGCLATLREALEAKRSELEWALRLAAQRTGETI